MPIPFSVQTQLNNNPYVVATVADLATIPANYTTAIVKDAKRGGIFNWSDTGTINNGITFYGLTGYWVRRYEGAIHVNWFGAVGNNTADDTAAIQAAFNAIDGSGGEVYIDKGTFKVTNTLTLPHNITLRSNSPLNGGQGRIISSAAYIFLLTKASVGSRYCFAHFYNVGIQGNYTNNFFQFPTGTSWAWSTMEGCYILSIKTFYTMNTGCHIIRNNFQNLIQFYIRGGDFTVSGNYMGYYEADTSMLTTDGFVSFYAAGNFTFNQNYVTCMRTSTPGPMLLKIDNSSICRVLDNWLDGGLTTTVAIHNGAHSVIMKHNRINTYSTTNAPVSISNSRTIECSENIFTNLQDNQPIVSLSSLILRVNIINNIVDSYYGDQTLPHNIKMNNVNQYVVFEQHRNNTISMATLSDTIYSSMNGKIINNYGAPTGTQFIYISSKSFLKGDFLYFNNVSANRTIIYNTDNSTYLYDTLYSISDNIKISCYETGSLVVEYITPLLKTIIATGTTGARTIHTLIGSVNFAAADTYLVVNNHNVTADSILQCTVATNDSTMFSARAVAAKGSFTIYANAAATAETRVNFSIVN